MMNRVVTLTCFVLTFAAVGFLAGCDEDSGTIREHRPGLIEFFEEPVVVEVPETVQVDESFVVAVRTYGGGCIEKGPTRVSESGSRTTIEPIDIFRRSMGSVCTSILLTHRHEVMLSFDSPGTVEILVRGVRRFWSDGRAEEEPLDVRRTLTVQRVS